MCIYYVDNFIVTQLGAIRIKNNQNSKKTGKQLLLKVGHTQYN